MSINTQDETGSHVFCHVYTVSWWYQGKFCIQGNTYLHQYVLPWIQNDNDYRLLIVPKNSIWIKYISQKFCF